MVYILDANVLQEGDVNPFTRQPHTPQYKKILEARKKLPVYAQMEEFYKMVRIMLHLFMNNTDGFYSTMRIRLLSWLARQDPERPHSEYLTTLSPVRDSLKCQDTAVCVLL